MATTGFALTPAQRAKIADKTTRGETVAFRETPIGVVEDEISRISNDGEYKSFLQRIRLSEAKAGELGSAYAYRWCYYSLSESLEKLPCGQSALLLGEHQLQDILAEAHLKRWPI
jgi:hypothetical protein